MRAVTCRPLGTHANASWAQVVDEVGYIPFDQDSANLFFQLVSSRHERASLILTGNLAFSRWADVFGDATIASAMIDRNVHHAQVINFSGNSYRLQGRLKPQTMAQQKQHIVALFSNGKGGSTFGWRLQPP
ncbi:uroporphyrinogen-III decarboxylase [Arthrobacter stackebrandtii]|uniref:Uroporphyrinogen-III decarboxylase n=1 Tax=Arthrobacter stackebrandtii TaxID=272161 RepID=A0ABS4YYD5_9MICC|nr:uroporphyrinogen-III decarboxylase [Arthrobacter stackebrandtii]